MGILDVLFPKRCIGCHAFGTYVCSGCFSKISFTDTDICAVCNHPAVFGATHPVCKKKYTLDGMSASFVYNGVVKKLVYKFKYPPYLADLQKTLVNLFYEGIIQKEAVMKLSEQNALLIPIPLHQNRMRKRGYNQAEMLARGLGELWRLPVSLLLQRIRPTISQISLSREQRMKNLSGAFRIQERIDGKKLQGKTILLVDDVSTSGATFLEAAKVLKRAGVKTVWGIALAHGQ